MISEAITTIIIDDEPLARRYLRSLLSNHPEFKILKECEDGPSAVEAIRELAPEVVWLDVQMPGQNGFDVVRTLGPGRCPVIVFVTAHDQYALEAFEAHALEYLLKPFDRARFDKAIAYVKNEIRKRRLDSNFASRLPALLDALQQHQSKQKVSETKVESRWITHLPIKTAERSFIVPVEEIAWVESADSYVYVHANGKRHLLRKSLTWIRLNFDPQKFLQIHRRVVVNLGHIKELRANSSGDFTVYLEDSTELPLSRRRRRHIEKVLGHSI